MVDARLLLANAANSAGDGSGINALGLGWRITGPSPLPAFVVLITIEGPLGDEASPSSFRLRLLDEREQVVTQGGPDHPQAVEVAGSYPPDAMKVARPRGLPPASTVLVELGAGLALDPGYYLWKLSLDGETRDDWQLRFYVRAKPDEFPAAVPISIGSEQ